MKTNNQNINYKLSKIMGINLWCITQDEFQSIIINEIKNGQLNNKAKFISYLNAHCFNVACSNRSYFDILSKADLLYADGQAVVWASKLSDNPLPERVNAGDFIIQFFIKCQEEGIKIFLLGGDEGVVSSSVAKFSQEVKGLSIVGYHHGYFKREDEEKIVNMINQSGAELILVGMSVPCQEEWAMRNIEKLNTKVIWCVGALFEYYSGIRRRAPVWMRSVGLEWLFRLMLEPKRLWKRYLIGNFLFTIRILRWHLLKRN